MQVRGSLPVAARADYATVGSALRAVVRAEGMRGYLRGISATLAAVPLHWAVYFSSYEHLKRSFGGCPEPDDTSWSAAMQTTLTSGAAAVGASVLTDSLTNPLWVIRTRLMTQHVHLAAGQMQAPAFTGPLDAARRIAQKEGISALYRGLQASWMASMHVCVQFPVYELTRRALLARRRERYPPRPDTDTEHRPSPVQNGRPLGSSALAGPDRASDTRQRQPWQQPHWSEMLLAASVSKLAASLASYPVELLRARLQDTSQPLGAGRKPVTMRAVFSGVVAADGLTGLYAGFGANLLRVLPACCITMVAYETLAHELALIGW